MASPSPTADALQQIDQQVCFSLYSASRLMIRLYHPLLEPLGLTYLQYMVLMVLWQHAPCSIGEVARCTRLESSTLSPVLKKLEQQKLIQRQSVKTDARSTHLALTPAGRQMKKKCAHIPMQLLKQTHARPAELLALKASLDQLASQLDMTPT